MTSNKINDIDTFQKMSYKEGSSIRRDANMYTKNDPIRKLIEKNGTF